MAAAAVPYNLLNLDFSSQFQALIQRSRARYPGVWNDFSASSFGTLLTGNEAWAVTTLAYTLNALTAENFITTMRLRESAVRTAALVQYALANPFPAAVYCTALLASPAPAAVTLSQGTPVKTADQSAINFELAQNYTIPPGAIYPQSVALTFDPNSSGTLVIQSLVSVTNGGSFVDCLDDTVDLLQYAAAGQVFSADQGTTVYVIEAVTQAPGAQSYNRLVLGSPWAAATASIMGQVLDRRIAFVQGTTRQEQFNPSTGAAYIATLSSTPVIDGSVSVTVNGAVWTVGSLATADSNAQVFQTLTLPTGYTAVLFGNGQLGAAPPDQAAIIITYRTGGGTSGNIAAGSISTTITGVVASLSSPVTIQVTNPQPGVGGANAESLDQARTNIPAWTRTNGRAVTRADYEALATTFRSTLGQVAFASANPSQANPLLEGNIIRMCAWTAGAGGVLQPVTGQFRSALAQYLQQLAVGPSYVLMVDGTTQALPFACRIQVAPGFDIGTVSGDVSVAITAYVTTLSPGQPVVYSALLSAILAVQGVATAALAAPASNITPADNTVAIVPPDPSETYAVTLQSQSSTLSIGQLQYVPRAAWAVSATLGGQALTVSPDVTPGYARLTGPGLDPTIDSSLNLTTGEVMLGVVGVVGDLLFQYTQVQAYSTIRLTSIYIGYPGDQSLALRLAIRAAVRAWADGLAVGAPLYAYPPQVANPATSVYDVVSTFLTAGTPTVAIDSPSNSNPQLNVDPQTLIQLSAVVINGLAN